MNEPGHACARLARLARARACVGCVYACVPVLLFATVQVRKCVLVWVCVLVIGLGRCACVCVNVKGCLGVMVGEAGLLKSDTPWKFSKIIATLCETMLM